MPKMTCDGGTMYFGHLILNGMGDGQPDPVAYDSDAGLEFEEDYGDESESGSSLLANPDQNDDWSDSRSVSDAPSSVSDTTPRTMPPSTYTDPRS
ncbi:unnamed protein product [Gongylonema pulchrum]|uniref:Iwr1 domain-containing protein n=1 Tax=Gongylonema pulchrum TaxID=637853 RepID=A0A183D0P9_9BILA|nr:unnamed protein product [Gongylonema pulchrum]